MAGPQLAGLEIADQPERWRALGFDVGADGVVAVGGVSIALGGQGRGITGWTLKDADGAAALASRTEHRNGVIAVDHVVIVTPDFDASSAALAARGLELSRVTEMRERRYGFRRAGPAIIELVHVPEAPAERFWGLTLVASDLDALHERLAPHLSSPRDAVQPGRRIATLATSAGLSVRLAFMSPE